MQRVRGPWWTALSLVAVVVIPACDHDDDDSATTSDVATEGEGASSDTDHDGHDDHDDHDDDGDDTRGRDDEEPLTCAELMCSGGEVCVQPRAYCDESTDPPELVREPAYCQPVVSPPSSSDRAGDPTRPFSIAACEDPQSLEGPGGRTYIVCPDHEVPCA